MLLIPWNKLSHSSLILRVKKKLKTKMLCILFKKILYFVCAQYTINLHNTNYFLCLNGWLTFTYLVQIKVLVGFQQAVLELLLLIQSGQKLVKHVVIPFVISLWHNPRHFQQIVGDFRAHYHSTMKKQSI